MINLLGVGLGTCLSRRRIALTLASNRPKGSTSEVGFLGIKGKIAKDIGSIALMEEAIRLKPGMREDQFSPLYQEAQPYPEPESSNYWR
jgi:hypothetical protein